MKKERSDGSSYLVSRNGDLPDPPATAAACRCGRRFVRCGHMELREHDRNERIGEPGRFDVRDKAVSGDDRQDL